MKRIITPGTTAWAQFLDMWARLENSPTISYHIGLGVICFLSIAFDCKY